MKKRFYNLCKAYRFTQKDAGCPLSRKVDYYFYLDQPTDFSSSLKKDFKKIWLSLAVYNQSCFFTCQSSYIAFLITLLYFYSPLDATSFSLKLFVFMVCFCDSTLEQNTNYGFFKLDRHHDKLSVNHLCSCSSFLSCFYWNASFPYLIVPLNTD